MTDFVFNNELDLAATFNHWSQFMIEDGQLTIGSAKIYASIWRKFSTTAASEPHQCASAGRLASLSVNQLSQIVTTASEGSATSYPKRMAQLVSRVMVFAFGGHAAAEMLPSLFLDNRKKDPVYAELENTLHNQNAEQNLSLDFSKSGQSRSDWKSIRDQAIAALCLYAGLRLNEIIQLRMTDIKSDAEGYVLSIKGQRVRTVPIAKAGNQFLSAWLTERSNICEQVGDVSHDYVFIATLSGGSVARLTVYRATKRVLGDSDHGTATAARNTFAARQIANGTDDQIISDWMGYRTDFTIARHKEAFRKKRTPKALIQVGEKRRPS